MWQPKRSASLRVGGEAGLVDQPFGGETAAGAQAGFAEAGEEMMAGLVFFHKILLCGCGERGCRAQGFACRRFKIRMLLRCFALPHSHFGHCISCHANGWAKGYLKNRRHFSHTRECAAADGSWGKR